MASFSVSCVYSSSVFTPPQKAIQFKLKLYNTDINRDL